MDQRSKHCSQQSAIRCFSYYLGLHIGDFAHESPLPVYQLLGSNSATADTFAFTPFWQTWLLSQCRTTLGGFLTCAVTLLTLRLGSSRYANGDGERVLSQQQADKACGVWRGAASGTSPPRYTHPGPRLILLLPACRSAPAHSPTGARPKKKSQTLRTAANPSNVISLWLFFLSSHFTFKKKNTNCEGLQPKDPNPKRAELWSRGTGTLSYFLNTSPASWGFVTCDLSHPLGRLNCSEISHNPHNRMATVQLWWQWLIPATFTPSKLSYWPIKCKNIPRRSSALVSA